MDFQVYTSTTVMTSTTNTDQYLLCCKIHVHLSSRTSAVISAHSLTSSAGRWLPETNRLLPLPLSLSLPPTLEPTLSYFPLYVCLLCNCNHWGSFRVCLFTLLGSLITLGNLIFLRLSSDMLYTTLTLNCVPLFQNLDTKLRRWNLHFTVSHISQNSTDTVYLPKPFSYQFSSPR